MNSELIIIRYDDWQTLAAEHACWEPLGRIIVEQLYIKKEMLERELLLLSAEERYLLFQEKYGHVAPHLLPVPHRLLSRHYAGRFEPNSPLINLG